MLSILVGLCAVLVACAVLLVLQREGRDPELTVKAPDPDHNQKQSVSALTATAPKLASSEMLSAVTVGCSAGELGFFEREREWTQKEVITLMARTSERLSVSTTAEHLHAAALLAGDQESRLDLFAQAIAIDRWNPLVLWGAVHACSESDETASCPLREWEQLLIAIDGQNSEVWIRVAANRYAGGELDAALDALRAASVAAESRVYWPEMIEMIERGFAAGSDFSFPVRAGMAFSLAVMPDYLEYTKMCREQSARGVDWAYACLAYGQRLEQQGKSEVSVAIAKVLQQASLEALDEDEQALEAEQKRETRRQQREARNKTFTPTAERLMISNPELFSSYLATVRSDGEVEAQHKLAVIVEQLLELRPDFACE